MTTPAVPRQSTETVVVLEASLDDCNPQVIGYVLERALELGALDAYAAPVQMKKGRPGVVVTLLVRPAQREEMIALLLRETTTLGVRATPTERIVLEREFITAMTEFGAIRMKAAANGEKAMPEYEDCRAAARRYDVSIQGVMDAARRAWFEKQNKH